MSHSENVYLLENKCFSSTVCNLKKPLLTPKCLSSRDGRMLFDYLADKHGVSTSADSSTPLRSSHDSSMNPVLFWGTNGRGSPEQQHIKWLPKTLSHFRGFYGLQKFLWTFTFCGELFRINGTARDPWVWPQECWGFYIWLDVTPTPASWNWPEACPQCTFTARAAPSLWHDPRLNSPLLSPPPGRHL